MFPSAEAAVTAPPPGPCPRRLLAAARHLAAGLAESMAAGLAGLPTATLRQLRGDPDFDELLDDCRAFEASPKAERNAVLERLTRAAIEQALADARVGAIPAAMRLLGLVPSTRPPGAASPDGEDAPGFGELLTCELPAVMRGVRQDDEGEWVGPDGLPVMPGRPLAVMAGAPGGPVRVLDIEPATVPPGFLEGLDEFDRAQAHAFNRGAYPSGGPQWDPVTRTLWCWGEPPEGPPRTDDGETRSAEADHLVTSAGLPGAAPAHAGEPVDPAPEPLPALPAPAHPAAGAVQVTPPDALEARVRRLLECAAAPAGPADTDLARRSAPCAGRTGRPTAAPSTWPLSAGRSTAASSTSAP